MIDSHCHLAGEEFAADLPAVVARARAAGLERALVILAAGDQAEAAQAARLDQEWPEVRLAVGVHPHSAAEYQDRPERAADVVRTQVETTAKARALGEMGLDYHYDFAPKPIQQAVFRAQLRLARELDLPVVIHTREADADTLALLDEDGSAGVRGVFHCFTGDAALARGALDRGFYISLAGIVTFNRAQELREVARTIPLDRLLTETDSPFLAPVPHRGTRNEPALVAQVVAALAGLHGVAPERLAERTAANFHSLFRP